MSSENQNITLNAYENNMDAYLKNTPNKVTDFQKVFLEKIISLTPIDSKILEVGSAVGRDADYFEDRGYKILRTDVVHSFIQYQLQKGKNVSKFNVINDKLDEKFDLILAFAVFLHFNSEEFISALANVKYHLHKNGSFAFSLKNGRGEEYSDHKMNQQRFFKYWSPNEITSALESNGFYVYYLNSVADGKWIHCIARLRQ